MNNLVELIVKERETRLVDVKKIINVFELVPTSNGFIKIPIEYEYNNDIITIMNISFDCVILYQKDIASIRRRKIVRLINTIGG